MTRVAVSGAAGRMGRLVCAAVADADDLELSACYGPAAANETAAGVSVSADPAVVAAAEVVVEFTRPDVVLGNLAWWHRLGVHAVVGTSGFDADRVEQVRELWGDGPGRCLIVPNFAVGAVLAMRLAEIAAPFFPVAEVVEMHHDAKADAPSGTALATAQRIGAVAPEQRRTVDGVPSALGALGAEVAGVRVHSVRLPGMVAHQEVLF
nr:4-hydroxy-tetrahydrodipicolinate reductase [Acidimicrobiia bacterium]